jgi:hypothetical protein
MFDEIPPEFRSGVDGLLVETEAAGHPSLPGIWTMGECITDDWPDGTGGIGDTRSRIVLYYGSFENLAEHDPLFDWEAELWETIVHELLHHREAAAAESGLEVFDWAVEQNLLRHAGRPFDPDFYRAIPTDADGAIRLEGETFVEAVLSPAERTAGFEWREHTYTLRVPADTGLTFVRVKNLAGGRLWVVLRRRVAWWRRLFGAAHRGRPGHIERRALPDLEG